MNTIQTGLITLLRCAITGERLALPEGFDMEQAYPVISHHHMATMAYQGAVLCGIPRSHPVMKQLFQSYYKAMQVSEGQLREYSRICEAFEANRIDYMPLKGCNMKPRYPQPELRMMGDADILIRLEQYDRIVPIMESLGFQAKLESDHELVWTSSALFLELHKHVIPSYNEDFYGYFGNGWSLGKIREGHRYSMTPEDEFIYLLTHFAKHFRDSGIGCRHVVDLWVFLRHHPALDESYVREELAKLMLEQFYDNIRKLICAWFEDGELDERTEFTTDFIFNSGSWGNTETRMLSAAVKDAKHDIVGGGRLTYLRKTLFPGVEALRDKYTILQRAPWLLPVVWIIRPFYKLLFERDGYRYHRNRLSLISRKNVRSRQDALKFMGLDYHF